MLGRNCTEMETQSTFTLAAEITEPVYQTLTYTTLISWINGVAVAPGACIHSNQDYYRVLVPFTMATATRYADLAAYCEPITYMEYATNHTKVVPYGVGNAIVVGDLVSYNGQFYQARVALASPSGVWATDVEAAGLSLANCNPAISGTVVTGTEAVPEYVELNLREVVEVGIKDSSNNWTQMYNIRIQQSPDPSVPVKVYTAGLPLGTAISYKGYRWPTQILTTATQMEIPVAHQEGLMRSMVMKSIEEAGGNNIYWAPLARTQEGDWMNYINRAKQASPRTRRTQAYNGLAG